MLSNLSWRQLALVSLGICSLSLPFAQIVNASPTKELPNYCKKNESTIEAVETKSFQVNICGNYNSRTYVGVNKKTGKGIRLPITDAKRAKYLYYYAAESDGYTYSLVHSYQDDNVYLYVNKGNRELLREPVLKSW